MLMGAPEHLSALSKPTLRYTGHHLPKQKVRWLDQALLEHVMTAAAGLKGIAVEEEWPQQGSPA